MLSAENEEFLRVGIAWSRLDNSRTDMATEQAGPIPGRHYTNISVSQWQDPFANATQSFKQSKYAGAKYAVAASVSYAQWPSGYGPPRGATAPKPTYTRTLLPQAPTIFTHPDIYQLPNEEELPPPPEPEQGKQYFT